MGCEEFREALSARLDGERGPVDATVTDAHLDGCADCRRWLDRAAAVTRMSRLRPADPEPTLPAATLAAILAAAPASGSAAVTDGRRRWTAVLWWLLGGLGAAQFLLGIAQIGGAQIGGSADHLHDAAGVTAGHLWHESAAWNVAIGAAFGWIALRRTRPAGSLPILTAFLAVLALVSVGDALGGRVEWSRLASHGVLVGGYVILLALRRLDDDGHPPAARADGASRWRVRFDEPPAPPTPLRVVHRVAPTTARTTDRAA